ncbi:MAG TPA: antitoxin VapB family protein [Candidatus Nanoarchaeia archaeon]|nr:antitoxin VapB family protein [Candidatus Nanoarchaeia archaeon]
MATKTLTIMEDAYNLLLNNKMESESFSEEIRRILSKKRKTNLRDYFGILTDNEAEGMKRDLKRIRAMNIELLQKRLKHESARYNISH